MMREVITGTAILFLTGGLVLLGLGFILGETGLFGLLLQVGGAYLSLHGAVLLLEAWIAGRNRS